MKSRKSHNEELHSLYLSSNIGRLLSLENWDLQCIHPELKIKRFQDFNRYRKETLGIPRRRWGGDNIRMYLKEIGANTGNLNSGCGLLDLN